MPLTPRAPLKWGGVKSTWLTSLPATIEMLTIDTLGNVQRQAIPSAVGGSTGSTDNRILRSDGTGGATVQNSAVSIDDSGNISGLGTVGCGAITSSGNHSCRNITQNSINSSTDGLNFVNTVSGTTGRIQAGYAGNYDGSLVISSGSPNAAAIAIGTEIVCAKGLSLTGASQTIKHSSNTHNRIDWSSAGSPGANIGALTEMRLSISSNQKLSITASEATFSTNLTVNGLVALGTYTVAALPSASANAGRLAQVTDSSVTANGSTVAGSGANRVVVFSNGSNWDVVVA